MTEKQFRKMGVPQGAAMRAAVREAREAAQAGFSNKEIRRMLKTVLRQPAAHRGKPPFGDLASVLASEAPEYAPTPNTATAPWKQWGTKLDAKAVEQMRYACALPIAVRGALMPDAHVGYGLPIGGVLATKGAVIPYAVGVDIACRMKLTVLDLPVKTLDTREDWLRRAIESETQFGVGSEFRDKRQHAVMDEDWTVSPVTAENKDKAWKQLGTSGAGNHFVEIGTLEISDASVGLEAGTYLALLSHSGSRGTGSDVCNHYSKIAKNRCRNLHPDCLHLAWLDLDSQEGQEYWAAMQLMGTYAAANHALIHRHIAQHLGAEVLLDVENHHNFAWEEEHDGERVIVHRKGATPASENALGIIPGSMATPGYVVRGKGNADSLNSASHGAGRMMSRTQAKKRFRWADAEKLFQQAGVTIISATLDELPMAYKDIDGVMRAQEDLVHILARFNPKLVKMAAR